MFFKVEKLCDTVVCVRGYRNESDISYIFTSTLHRPEDKKEWQIKATMSAKTGTKKEAKETLRFLKNFPDGVWTYVTKNDMDRFYTRYCNKIRFENCEF